MSLRDLIPFGLASEKPWHYRDMARAVWINRDNCLTPGAYSITGFATAVRSGPMA